MKITPMTTPEYGVDPLLLNHPAYLLTARGQPVMAAGLVPWCGGVSEAWAVVIDHDLAVKYKADVVDLCRDMIKSYMIHIPLHRVHALIETNNPMLVRWMKMMRFVQEGCLIDYGGDGIDYNMYRFVRDDK